MMGKVVVSIRVENIGDAVGAMKGDLPWDKVRAVDVPDALVDTGATLLLLPKKIIERLGLVQFRVRQAKGLGGTVAMPIYSAVRLTVQGRDCTIDVGEVSDELPAIIGQIPLEMMDWVIDTRGQKLIGNSEHGGEQIFGTFGGSVISSKRETCDGEYLGSLDYGSRLGFWAFLLFLLSAIFARSQDVDRGVVMTQVKTSW